VDEFADLESQLVQRLQWDNGRLEREVSRRDALVKSDLTPVDVVWRRTWALLEHLRAGHPSVDLSREIAALEGLQAEVVALRARPGTPAETQRNLFNAITTHRRAIAFQNPLLDFDAILFLKHNKQARGYRHMVDQYLGFNAERAGGLYVLEAPFGPTPQARSLLANSRVENGRLAGHALENRGGFIGLDLDYDAQSILFAFTEAAYEIAPDASYTAQYWRREDVRRDPGAAHHYFRPESAYHIFRARTDGTALTQLTDGMWNDIDPVFLPNGRVAFISERAGGQVRCGCARCPAVPSTR
jgi:hypothetical protein